MPDTATIFRSHSHRKPIDFSRLMKVNLQGSVEGSEVLNLNLGNSHHLSSMTRIGLKLS